MRPILLAFCLAASLSPLTARAEGPTEDQAPARTFIIAEQEGYGVSDCLAGGTSSSCGKVVADAWCEAHGYASAVTFGRVDSAEVTGALAEEAADAGEKHPIVITCRD